MFSLAKFDLCTRELLFRVMGPMLRSGQVSKMDVVTKAGARTYSACPGHPLTAWGAPASYRKFLGRVDIGFATCGM